MFVDYPKSWGNIYIWSCLACQEWKVWFSVEKTVKQKKRRIEINRGMNAIINAKV